MKSEYILGQMLDIFRGNHHFTTDENTQVVLQILAWAKLSLNESLPSDLQLTKNSRLTTSTELFNSFKRLSKCPELGENKAAFENIAYLHRDISPGVFVEALDFALDSAQKNLLNSFDFPEDFYLSFLSHGSPIPIEVIKVMSALAGDLKGKRVYCPYDSLCLIARQVSKQDGIPSIETPWVSPIPWLISILTDANIRTIVTSDPLQRPAFLKEGNLQKFDFTIAFPLFGQKIDIEVYKRDLFNRFKEPTSSGSVLTLYHIIAQTEGKAIVAIPGSILFSRGAEHLLRKDLLQQEMIEAVLSMPAALLPFTPIPFSILILNTRGKASTVRFVDGAAEQFSTRDGRNRSKLVNWELLLEIFHNSNDEAIVANIPTIDILLKNDANLEVSRYLLPPAQKVIRHLLSKNETRKLSDLVTFLRPSKPLPKNETEGIPALEVGVSDFPNYGYLTTPERRVLLSPKVFNSQEGKSFLCPRDIIISIKGSAGKLAIIPDNVPPVGPNAWVVNQSSLIMRPQGSIDPRVLFMYLCSDVGETLLKAIISGATVPLIQLQHLKDVEIIVPDAAKAESIINTFKEQVEIQDQINKLQEELQHLSKSHWNISSSTRG
ncbi:N-6 DNA methylase [Microcoleus sp. MOSTC5]|uniref:N-6 DNA methylase n=1 Tax=Microcoleus sp. MOSTC5 TaxID=3055378 RepID=UPI002FCF422F